MNQQNKSRIKSKYIWNLGYDKVEYQIVVK